MLQYITQYLILFSFLLANGTYVFTTNRIKQGQKYIHTSEISWGLAIFFNTYGEKSTTQLTLILIRSTFYNFAKHLEKKGDISSAIQNYEKSGTHRFEVPRLLFEDWNILEAYIQVIFYKSDVFFHLLGQKIITDFQICLFSTHCLKIEKRMSTTQF